MLCDRIPLGRIISVTVIFYVAWGYAHDDRQPPPTSISTQAPTTQEPETLKERLSDKATDEQRVDNCNVPVDRRGPKARPEGCSHKNASAARSKPPR
jgi:hypothetical protein